MAVPARAGLISLEKEGTSKYGRNRRPAALTRPPTPCTATRLLGQVVAGQCPTDAAGVRRLVLAAASASSF